MINYKKMYVFKVALMHVAILLIVAVSSVKVGMIYSNQQHELIKQANMERVVKLMDCLQGRIKC